ncbi:acyl carrier protein, partial [Streptomonospora sediminis]
RRGVRAMDPGLALGVLGEVLRTNTDGAGPAGAAVLGSANGAGCGSGGAAVGSGAGGNGGITIGSGNDDAISSSTGNGVAGSSITTGSGGSCVVVADVDWVRFAATFGAERARPLISDIPEVANAAHDEPPEETGLAATLAALPESERMEYLLDLVRTRAGAVLGYSDDEALDPEQRFRELGFDSLTAVDLRNALTRATGLTLPTTVVFDHPTARALAVYLHGQLLDSASGETIHADVERLEHVVATTELTDSEKRRIADRLKLVLRELDGAPRTAAAAEELDSASDDDLFAFIDDQLGRS